MGGKPIAERRRQSELFVYVYVYFVLCFVIVIVEWVCVFRCCMRGIVCAVGSMICYVKNAWVCDVHACIYAHAWYVCV